MTTLFGIESIPAAAVIEAPAAQTGASAGTKKNGWLPVLSILFLISYGLMTMLIVEQGRTIESQRALIHELYRDSSELAATKRALQDGSSAIAAPTQAPTQAPSTQTRSTQTPSTQTPSTQTQTLSSQTQSTQANTQAPSSQAGPQTQHAQNQSAKTSPEFKMPSKPEPDLVDDVRTLNII